MSADLITTDEIRAMFGDTMPLDAVRILFPELHKGGEKDTRSVSAVRADLVASALRHRSAPLKLSAEDQAERLAMLHVLISAGTAKPVRRDFLAETVDDLLSMPDALAYWDPMIDEALDIMREARARMSKRFANPSMPRRRAQRMAP